MDKKIVAANLADRVKKIAADEGLNLRIDIHESVKQGQTLTAMLVRNTSSENTENIVSPCFYVESFINDIESNGYETAAKILLEMYKEHCDQEFNIDFIYDYDKAKPLLSVRLVNLSDTSFLEGKVYKEFCDLAIVPYVNVLMDENGSSIATTVVNTKMMEIWGVSKSQILTDAKANCENERMACVSMSELVPILSPFVPLYVATVTNAYDIPENLGAKVMITEKFKEMIEDTVGQNCYIIPSSAHEVIVLEDSGDESPEALLDLIASVNETSVSKEDFLSNSLYYYSSRTKTISIVS